METPKQSVEIRTCQVGMQRRPRSNLLKSAPPGLNAMETPKQSVEIRTRQV
jgi:hypothetical protein